VKNELQKLGEMSKNEETFMSESVASFDKTKKEFEKILNTYFTIYPINEIPNSDLMEPFFYMLLAQDIEKVLIEYQVSNIPDLIDGIAKMIMFRKPESKLGTISNAVLNLFLKIALFLNLKIPQ